jgi:hypothetical protein
MKIAKAPSRNTGRVPSVLDSVVAARVTTARLAVYGGSTTVALNVRCSQNAYPRNLAIGMRCRAGSSWRAMRHGNVEYDARFDIDLP